MIEKAPIFFVCHQCGEVQSEYMLCEYDNKLFCKKKSKCVDEYIKDKENEENTAYPR